MTDQTSETTPDALDVAAVRERVEAATEGPWDLHMVQPDMGGRHQYGLRGAVPGPRGAVIGGSFRAMGADAEFIAHARTDIPLLLAALDEARAMVADYERGICWDSTCLNCARTIERGHADYERAEAAEARAAAGDRALRDMEIERNMLRASLAGVLERARGLGGAS